MTATFYVGDAIEVMGKLPEKSVDLVLTSPPFLALRSYLPADHPDKAKEGGSQATPGEYIDWLLDVVEACERVLAPHGSLCFELGDTYSGSGGAGGDYAENGLREGQAKFRAQRVTPDLRRSGDAAEWAMNDGTVQISGGRGWPLAKSLSLIPETFRFAMVYGHNPFTGRRTAPWRLRNVIRWVRPNPPVGALGDKFRPATSELMVFCKAKDRYFDLDAVREPVKPHTAKYDGQRGDGAKKGSPDRNDGGLIEYAGNPAGAPPLDWWNIPLLEGEEPTKGGPKEPKPIKEGIFNGPKAQTPSEDHGRGTYGFTERTTNPAGSPPLDWWNIPPGGYVIERQPVNPGEFVGGTLYIESEGCPLHAGWSDPVATVQHGEPVDTQPSHSSDNDAGRGRALTLDFAPTDPPPALPLEDGSSDSLSPQSNPAAKRRNKASNKTAPVPATSPLDTPYEETPSHIDDTSETPLSGEPHPDIPESRTDEADQPFDVLETYARTGHKPAELEACTCSFYVENSDSTSHYAVKPGKPRNRQAEPAMGRGGNWNTFPNLESSHPMGAPPLDWWNIPPGGFSGAHYAVWPPELLIKPIKAMCPEKVCRVCGEPSRRIVETERLQIRQSDDRVKGPIGNNATGKEGVYWTKGLTTRDTLGFSDCGHDDWRPGLVLDPFAGSGTTLAVATGHGRDAIGIDLDERNFDLALQRVGPFILERQEI